MSSFKMATTLEQHTPMIHFQHTQKGATLRASEVKPKLDRFIIKKVGNEVHNEWRIGDSDALNYRMTISAKGEPIKSTTIEYAKKCIRNCGNATQPGTQPDIGIAKSYFGNMVKLKDDQALEEKYEAVDKVYKETVFFNDEISLTINCFIPGLLNIIKDNIVDFFLLHNFGTRSHMGFGSFMVTKLDGEDVCYQQENSIEKRLKNNYKQEIYRCNYNGMPNGWNGANANRANKLLGYADELYKLMKSGYNFRDDYFRSFLFIYMHNAGGIRGSEAENIGNEKAFLKRKHIAPCRGRNSNINNHENKRFNGLQDNNYRYVRAMLGVGDSLKFGDTEIEISPGFTFEDCRKEKGFRYPSPILFKIIRNSLFIIPNPENVFIFDKTFKFEKSNNSSCTLSTPSKNEFDIDDFVSKFAVYINDDCDPSKYCTGGSKLSEATSIKFKGTVKKL